MRVYSEEAECRCAIHFNVEDYLPMGVDSAVARDVGSEDMVGTGGPGPGRIKGGGGGRGSGSGRGE